MSAPHIADQILDWIHSEKPPSIQDLRDFLDSQRKKDKVAQSAALKMWDSLLMECLEKHHLDPRETALNGDYHLEVTLSVSEVRNFAKSILSNTRSELSRPAQDSENQERPTGRD